MQIFKHSNTQTNKSPNVQTKKVRSKLERNNEFQVIKYITNSNTKQPKTLSYTIANTCIQIYMFSCKQY